MFWKNKDFKKLYQFDTAKISAKRSLLHNVFCQTFCEFDIKPLLTKTLNRL